MTANNDFERRVASYYEGEGSYRAPDRVLIDAIATIETTSQRRVRVRVPWRFPTMNNSMRLAVAAVAVIAVAGIGLGLSGRFGGPGGRATPTPSPTIGPSPTLPATPLPTTPPLSKTFTSTLAGISIAYPAGWTARAATAPWASAADLPWNFDSSAADFLFDPIREGNLFVGVASQPLASESSTEWVNRMLAISDPAPCATTEPVEVDGAQGRLATCDEPLRAFVTVGPRGYAIFLYRSGDEPWVPDVYGLAFFNDLLGSVQLRPEDTPAASPSPS